MIINCQGFDNSSAFKEYAEQSFEHVVGKYATRFDSLHVHAERTPVGFQVHIKVHIPHQEPIRTEGEDETVHKAYDSALLRMGKKVRRFKRYHNDHRRGHIV